MEARIARQRALDALKEDRENRKVRNQGPAFALPTDSRSGLQEPVAVTGAPPVPAPMPAAAPSNAMVQVNSLFHLHMILQNIIFVVQI
jgi:hypothetical protein